MQPTTTTAQWLIGWTFDRVKHDKEIQIGQDIRAYEQYAQKIKSIVY